MSRSHCCCIHGNRNAATTVVCGKKTCVLLLLTLVWRQMTVVHCRSPSVGWTPQRAAAWGGLPSSISSLNHQHHEVVLEKNKRIPNDWSQQLVVRQLRGGSAETEEDDYDDDASNDEQEEAENEEDSASEDDDEEEYDSDEEEEEEEDGDEATTASTSIAKPAKENSDYVDPWFPSPMMGIYSTIGLMMLSRRTDLFSPTVVKVARFAFIAYVVVLQLFLVYVRFQAKAANDRTPIQLSNPLSGLLAQQMGGSGAMAGAGAGMMKSLASSFLASSSTVLEYDLSQARNMQGGILFNLFFMWLLHFKMQQVQPLILTTVNGCINLVYSPLFQVYVLGRHLERPFKSQPALMAEMRAAEEEEQQQEAAEAQQEKRSSVKKSEAKTYANKAKSKAVKKSKQKKKVVEEEVEDTEEIPEDDDKEEEEAAEEEEEEDVDGGGDVGEEDEPMDNDDDTPNDENGDEVEED